MSLVGHRWSPSIMATASCGQCNCGALNSNESCLVFPQTSHEDVEMSFVLMGLITH